ncbi:hypothetical protein LINPERPRIM_LOCUS39203 [Linum perenne]
MGKFSSKKIWESIRSDKPKVVWYSLLWKGPSIHRHNFIVWLAILNRLSTRDKLANWGLTQDTSCLFCSMGVDSRDHVLVTCGFASALKARFLHCFNFQQHATWEEDLDWAIYSFSGNQAVHKVGRVVWRSVVTHIWKERCRRVFGGPCLDVEALGNRVLAEVRALRGDDAFSNHVSLFS